MRLILLAYGYEYPNIADVGLIPVCCVKKPTTGSTCWPSTCRGNMIKALLPKHQKTQFSTQGMLTCQARMKK